ncbi:hypothetical protein Q3W71_14045 [Micromonospora sp. C28SCA-DRY-2]|uniref:hypothetical protein n=1 Tax=Micromonospora sp. C28SCA-DRY-2 TaxID=3059522 RepID=UPI002676E665|nr:hypothetical protein [Micromonospora sp. C28SCA-DRY-2]MDO3702791.1 hypothetical protein [Micromonospora sp. C28SCA-DRY-2]
MASRETSTVRPNRRRMARAVRGGPVTELSPAPARVSAFLVVERRINICSWVLSEVSIGSGWICWYGSTGKVSTGHPLFYLDISMSFPRLYRWLMFGGLLGGSPVDPPR